MENEDYAYILRSAGWNGYLSARRHERWNGRVDRTHGSVAQNIKDRESLAFQIRGLPNEVKEEVKNEYRRGYRLFPRTKISYPQ